MGKPGLLNTRDGDLREILANGRAYEVPPFQRDYSWKEQNWEDLWTDVMEVRAEPGSQHYMGTIVLLKKPDEAPTLVIDGQQRLTTLSILILAVISILNELAERAEDDSQRATCLERSELLRNRYIGEKNPVSLFHSSKLKLNRNDRNFFEANLIQLKPPISLSKLTPSNRLLWDCLKYFQSRLRERTELAESPPELAQLVDQTLAEGLVFIRVFVEDEAGAYTVFETLNARGIELTTSDLLKNYIMALVARGGEGDLNHVLARWERITMSVGAKDVPVFLRHFLNSRQDYVRQERLFKAIKARIDSREKAVEFLDELELAADWYQALRDPDDPRWSEDEAAREYVRVLHGIFRVTQYKPLILAAVRQKFPMKRISALLRICRDLSMRYNVIGDRNPSSQETAYNRAAMAVSSGAASAQRQIIELLGDIHVPDEEFARDFALKSMPASGHDRKRVLYILQEIERQVRGKELREKDSRAAIEHILPEGLEEESWREEFDDANHRNYLHRLGNYALLEKKLNQKAAAKSFAVKRSLYEKSEFKTTLEIDHEEWTPETIRTRQERMAKIACAIWKL